MENLLLQLQTSIRGLWIARVCSVASSHLTATDHYRASLCLVRHVTIKLLICLSSKAFLVANVSIQASGPIYHISLTKRPNATELRVLHNAAAGGNTTTTISAHASLSFYPARNHMAVESFRGQGVVLSEQILPIHIDHIHAYWLVLFTSSLSHAHF